MDAPVVADLWHIAAAMLQYLGLCAGVLLGLGILRSL